MTYSYQKCLEWRRPPWLRVEAEACGEHIDWNHFKNVLIYIYIYLYIYIYIHVEFQGCSYSSFHSFKVSIGYQRSYSGSARMFQKLLGCQSCAWVTSIWLQTGKRNEKEALLSKVHQKPLVSACWKRWLFIIVCSVLHVIHILQNIYIYKYIHTYIYIIHTCLDIHT